MLVYQDLKEDSASGTAAGQQVKVLGRRVLLMLCFNMCLVMC